MCWECAGNVLGLNRQEITNTPLLFLSTPPLFSNPPSSPALPRHPVPRHRPATSPPWHEQADIARHEMGGRTWEVYRLILQDRGGQPISKLKTRLYIADQVRNVLMG
ncbi:unnamed protein product [Closterium sp. NIES-53]